MPTITCCRPFIFIYHVGLPVLALALLMSVHSDGSLREINQQLPAQDIVISDGGISFGGTVGLDPLAEQQQQPPPSPPSIDPDSGVVINWTALDDIVASYAPTPPEQWLLPPTSACSCTHLQYRPLYCPWYIKPFRDAFDFVVTETEKWPTSRKLLGCNNNNNESNSEDMLNGPQHTGLPMLAYFGTECCRVYANATQAYIALSDFDTCWFEEDELQRCFESGHYVPLDMVNLTAVQYMALRRNATYADLATPHL